MQAVLDRIDEQFEFPLPAAPERLRMLKQFMRRYLGFDVAEEEQQQQQQDGTADSKTSTKQQQEAATKQTHKKKQKDIQLVVDKQIDENYLKHMAEKTEGFSGRQLAKVNQQMLQLMHSNSRSSSSGSSGSSRCCCCCCCCSSGSKSRSKYPAAATGAAAGDAQVLL